MTKAPHLFTIPPGVPFLRQLADDLCNGRLVAGFGYCIDDPLSLSHATIYVPTRRSARALRSEFVDLLNRKSAILPTIRTLGEQEDDADFLEEEQPALLDLLPPIGATDRLLELAQLIMLWKQNLPKSVSGFHGDNRLIAPANPADAVWLARSLADLLEAMETEQRPWSAFDDLVGADYATWWQLTLEFLKIATRFWPARLAELDCSDPAAHRNALLSVEAVRLSGSVPDGPVIVAGSTGSIPATAQLMKIVAGLDQGAVVLPGLDTMLSEDVWALVGGNPTGAAIDPATCAHPQYGLHRLISTFSATRHEILQLGQPLDAMMVRNKLVSNALMPAEATALWANNEIRDEDVSEAFLEVELIEAASEREEALAIAIAIRLAAALPAGQHGENRQVALVTPDRNLARRVASELHRFGIDANDSGGVFLAATMQGTLLQLLLQCAFGSERSLALVALMKHPLAGFGMDAAAARRAGRIVERVALRGGTGDVSVTRLLSLYDRRLAERQGEQRHAPHWFRRLSQADMALARDLVTRVEAASALSIPIRQPMNRRRYRVNPRLSALSVNGPSGRHDFLRPLLIQSQKKHRTMNRYRSLRDLQHYGVMRPGRSWRNCLAR